MAEYYCDHGAYGLTSNRIGLDAPTWGVPQEGDGSTKDAAAAGSVGSFKFNAVPTSGSISVYGATVTLTGVLSAASAAAAATALAASINATTAAVTSGFATGVPQLRNFVFARVNPGDSAEVQIMCRVGSVTLNVTGITHSFNGTAPTVVQFTGGSGGCWGWAINPVDIGVFSSITKFTYGALFQGPMLKPTVTAIADDTLWIRTGGGQSKTITLTNPSGDKTLTVIGQMCVMFDTNTKWTGDSASGALKIISVLNDQYTSFFIQPCVGTFPRGHFEALAPGGFTLEHSSPAHYYASSTIFIPGINSDQGQRFYGKNLRFIDSAPFIGSGQGFGFAPFGLGDTYSNYHEYFFDDCLYEVTTPRAIVRPVLPTTQGVYPTVRLRMSGCNLNFNISSPADPGALMNVSTSSAVLDVHLKGCHFGGYASGHKLLASSSGISSMTAFRAVLEDCGGLKLPASYLGIQSALLQYTQSHKMIAQSSESSSSGQGMRIEDLRGVAEWLPGESPAFPTLSAVNTTTGLPWSLRLLWMQTPLLGSGNPYLAPDLRMQSNLPSGVRTMTLELMVPTGTTAGVEATFTYTDSSGVARAQTVNVLSASAAVWVNAASFASHETKKLVVTSAYSVKGYSPITCTVKLTRSPATSVAAVYIDPEFLVA